VTTFIDIHVLQTVPPSNLNRDDSGAPKSAIYGGARRSRVSSQSWKRATRRGFRDVDPTNAATRTKRVAGLVKDRLLARYPDLPEEQALRLANAMLAPLNLSAKKGQEEIDYLMFLGHGQVDALIDTITDIDGLVSASDDELKGAFDKSSVAEIFAGGHPVDVALFGRMVADIANLRVDAACQVAHAISTHAVATEHDYFTAVDDEKGLDESAGAAHIGTVEFNSATLYRYANIALDGLVENLDEDRGKAIDATKAFVRAFVLEMPTGKSNTFANRTVPHAVVLCVRDGAPINAVTAFERPVIARDGSGHAVASLDRLAEELDRIETTWVPPAVLTLATYDSETIDRLGESRSFESSVDALGEFLVQQGAEGEG
jgi:CRISPR system Cascade subunit CasC